MIPSVVARDDGNGIVFYRSDEFWLCAREQDRSPFFVTTTKRVTIYISVKRYLASFEGLMQGRCRAGSSSLSLERMRIDM